MSLIDDAHANRPKRVGRPRDPAIEAVRNGVRQILDGCLPSLMEDIQSLEPKDRVKFMLDLFEYVIPKLGRTTIDVTEEAAQVMRSWAIVPIQDVQHEEIEIIGDEDGKDV